MKPPEELRSRIAGDLKPVRPLLAWWQRALLLVPAVALAWAAAPVFLGLRGDLSALGPLLAWGGSVVQLAVAMALVVAALRESIPAERLSRSSAWWLLAGGALITVVLAFATNAVSPEAELRSETFESWLFCWKGAVLTGAPFVALLAVLLARGLPMRPMLAGALAGLGAGAAVDGGWRLYCNYSNPSHVLLSHGGAVLALTLACVAVGWIVSRPRR